MDSTRTSYKDMRYGTWNVRSLFKTGAVHVLTSELKKLKIDIVALQETNLDRKAQNFSSGGYHFWLSSDRTDHRFGTGFAVSKEIEHLVLSFKKIDARMCVLRIKGRFKNYSIMSVHAPTNEKPEEEKQAFYDNLSKVYDEWPQHDIKMILGDFNAKIGKEDSLKPTIGQFSLHDETNENGWRLVDYAAEKGMVVRSTFFANKRIHLATGFS